MEHKDTSIRIKDQEKSKLINSNNKLEKLKSDYFIQKLFDYIYKRKSLEIIKYNKSVQKRINININNYKEYSEIYSSIEIEIKPKKNEYSRFINIDEYEEEYYHIYYNDNKKEEIKRTYLHKNDKVSKINIIIDYHVTSFSRLFSECECIESIYFKKFYRNNITNMSEMFYFCKSLKKINFKNFNTSNVTEMKFMFSRCKSLKKLDLKYFNTSKVTDMFGMFRGCKSLQEINLSSFNTRNVTDIRYMFSRCESLEELNLNNINYSLVHHSKSLKYL